MKKIILLINLSLLLFSCGITKRDFKKKIAIPVDKNYLKSDELFKASAPITTWWEAFNDTTLNTLIQKARINNLDINTATANLFAARALLKGTKFDQYPTLTTNGNYTRTRLGENVFVQGVNPTFNTYNASFDAAWELDFFGGVSAKVQQAYAIQKVALADMQRVYVSIFAKVARNYIALRGTQHQLDIARRNLKDQIATYELTEQLFQVGRSSNLDTTRAKAQLEKTKSSLPILKAKIAAIENRLSILIGEEPGNLGALLTSKKNLPNLPKTVLTGRITELLRRRPDIRIAEAKLQQQIAKYNISVATLYPQISFNGSIGFSAVDFSNFGKQESFTWSIMPNIHWAAFNLGRVKKQINRDDALTLAALQQYKKTVLTALEEIRTAMNNYQQQLKQREFLRSSAAASAQSAKFARERYKAGLDSFIDYLNADRILLQIEHELATSEMLTATSLIAIYKSLGGGWEIISEEVSAQKFERLKHTDQTRR